MHQHACINRNHVLLHTVYIMCGYDRLLWVRCVRLCLYISKYSWLVRIQHMNIGTRGLIGLVHVNSKDANQPVRKRRLIGINAVP